MTDKSNDHPSTHNILSLFITKKKKLLVGTNGAGLFRVELENNNLVTHYGDNVFQELSIGSIVEYEDETIWVNGTNGITHIDLKSNKAINYNKDDGLLSNDFSHNSVCYAKDGTMYFGSYEGLNFFKPYDIEFNQIPPVLHFTDFKIFNKEVDYRQKDSPLSGLISSTKKIKLNYDQSVFTIGYVGINYTRPEKNSYAYQLVGVDPDWRYVGNEQKATYTNLQAGNYTFKVKAANNDGLWNKVPIELKIVISPPWWKSSFAYILYSLLFIGFLYVISEFAHQRLKEKQAVQIEREKRLQEEKLSQQKLEFFTNISHEFRTPLTLIINPLEDLIKNTRFNLPEDVKRKHQIIYKNSDRLNRLINELMDFRKLQNDKLSIYVEQVEVIGYIEDTLTYFKEEAKDRKINLEYLPQTSSLVAWLDLSMLEKIIFNLVSNAFKVTPNNGTITVSIKEKRSKFPLSNFSNEKEGVEISIQDTGAGLTQTEVGEIFKRFSQVHKLKNNYYGGTGIGLEVVKDFTELHKGKIEVESKVGKGSNFKISFLLGIEHFSNEEILNQKSGKQFIRNPKPIPNPIHSFQIQGEKVNLPVEINSKIPTLLIVEDNIDMRSYLKEELKFEFNILLADNGVKGLEIAQKETPHIIMTDVMMPELDGMELCERIKSDLRTSHIPLLMLTAKARSTDKKNGIDSGADAYLTKPFDMELLKSTLSQLLTSRQILENKYSNGIKIDEEVAFKATSLDHAFIKKMVSFINENIGNQKLSVEMIAEHFFLSRSQLYRKTKSLTGISVNEFIRKLRLEEAKKLIKKGEGNISEVSYKVGFSSPSYFAKCFKEEYEMLPKDIE